GTLLDRGSLGAARAGQAGLPVEWLSPLWRATLWRAALRIVRLTAGQRLAVRPGPDRRTSAGACRAAAPLRSSRLLDLRRARLAGAGAALRESLIALLNLRGAELGLLPRCAVRGSTRWNPGPLR